jgi:hypothetical protein
MSASSRAGRRGDAPDPAAPPPLHDRTSPREASHGQKGEEVSAWPNRADQPSRLTKRKSTRTSDPRQISPSQRAHGAQLDRRRDDPELPDRRLPPHRPRGRRRLPGQLSLQGGDMRRTVAPTRVGPAALERPGPRHEAPIPRINPSGHKVWVARYTNRRGQRKSAGTFDLKRDAQAAIDAAYEAESVQPARLGHPGRVRGPVAEGSSAQREDERRERVAHRRRAQDRARRAGAPPLADERDPPPARARGPGEAARAGPLSGGCDRHPPGDVGDGQRRRRR